MLRAVFVICLMLMFMAVAWVALWAPSRNSSHIQTSQRDGQHDSQHDGQQDRTLETPTRGLSRQRVGGLHELPVAPAQPGSRVIAPTVRLSTPKHTSISNSAASAVSSVETPITSTLTESRFTGPRSDELQMLRLNGEHGISHRAMFGQTPIQGGQEGEGQAAAAISVDDLGDGNGGDMEVRCANGCISSIGLCLGPVSVASYPAPPLCLYLAFRTPRVHFGAPIML